MTTETATLAPDVVWRERVDDHLDHVEGRLERVDDRLGHVEGRLAAIEATLPHFATKADLYAAINALTWRLIVAGVALAGVVIAAIAAAAAWIKLF